MNRKLAGQTVLVTGGAGFIGSHLVDRLIRGGAEQVVVIDSLFVGDEANLDQAAASGKLTFYRDDIEFPNALEYVFERHSIDSVFNCATKALNYSFLNPSNAFSTNVTGTLNLLELQRRGAFKTLCHFSTSEVYGTAVYEPMDENHPRNPTTTYAAGKAAADMAVESYARMFELDSIVVRPFNNYGPRQNYRGMLAGVIPITAWRIHEGLAPEVHGTGRQSRDFIFVADTVDAVIKLFECLPAGESMNISTDNQVAIEDLIKQICGHLDYQGQVVPRDARAADVICHNASNEKLRALIDFQLTPFDEGLATTLDWYRSRWEGTGQ